MGYIYIYNTYNLHHIYILNEDYTSHKMMFGWETLATQAATLTMVISWGQNGECQVIGVAKGHGESCLEFGTIHVCGFITLSQTKLI